MIEHISKDRIEPTRIRIVNPFSDREDNMVLIEGRRGKRHMMKMKTPIVVYKEQGVYSDEIHEIYGF